MEHPKKDLQKFFEIGADVASDGFQNYLKAIATAHEKEDKGQKIPFHPIQVVALQQMYFACIKKISEMNDETVKVLRRNEDDHAIQMQHNFMKSFQDYLMEGNDFCEHFLDRSIRDMEALMEDRGIAPMVKTTVN